MSNEGGLPAQSEVEKFEAAASKFAEREGLTIEDASEKLAELLTNLAEHPLEIFALQLGLEDLEERVAALEKG